MDFLIDTPSHYVDAHAPIQGIVIESDNLSYSVVPSLEVCASAVARALLVRDPTVYSPWYVMPPLQCAMASHTARKEGFFRRTACI